MLGNGKFPEKDESNLVDLHEAVWGKELLAVVKNRSERNKALPSRIRVVNAQMKFKI